MARRRRGDEDDEAMLAYFLGNQQQQRGGGDDLMRLALAVLGMGPEREKLGAELGLKREELAAQERLRGQEATGQEAARAHEREMQRIANKAVEEDRKYKEALLGVERGKVGATERKAEMDLLAEYAKAHPELKLEEFQKMIAPYSETMQRVLTGQLEQSQKQKAADLEKAVRTLYQERKPMEQFKTLLGGYEQFPEAVARVPWGQLAQEAPGPGGAAQGAGLAGLLWNAPTALQNVGRGIANLASRTALGQYGPQAQYAEFTSPFEQGPPSVVEGETIPLPRGPSAFYGYEGSRPRDEAMRRYLGSVQ